MTTSMSVWVRLLSVAGVLAWAGCDKPKTEDKAADKAADKADVKADAKAEDKPDAKAEDKADGEADAKAEVVEPAEAAPAVDPSTIVPVAGEGFESGAAPSKTNAVADQPEPLTQAGVAVTAIGYADADAGTIALRVRVEFPGAKPEQGLNHTYEDSERYCDEVVPSLQAIGTVGDDRWLVDAQLACRSGEDAFTAQNEHRVLLIDLGKRSAKQIWLGYDELESYMGACTSSTLHSFVIAGDELVVSETDVVERDTTTDLDPELLEDCPEPVPEKTSELARVALAG